MGKNDISIYSQYKQTNIEKLVMGIYDIFDKWIPLNIKEFADKFYNLNTAVGVGLDCWGEFLNLPRNIKYEENGETYSYYLEDDEYLLLLKLKLLNMRISPTIISLNQQLYDIFNKFGIVAFIKDNFKMELITYVFEAKIPFWLKSAFENYDVLPHPEGVGVNFIESLYGYFGFEGQELTNFYQAIYYN